MRSLHTVLNTVSRDVLQVAEPTAVPEIVSPGGGETTTPATSAVVTELEQEIEQTRELLIFSKVCGNSGDGAHKGA
jgi:hypothetical protein